MKKNISIPGESKQFYKSLFTIVGPIAIQNLISAAVNSVDVYMLGFIGQTAIAASSLAGYVQFILFLFFTGLSSGLVMLCAQYWGKKDCYTIETVFGITLKISCAVGLVFALLAFFIPRQLMQIFTNEPDLIDLGSQYLKIVSVSYFMLSISQAYQAVLRSIEKVKTVTVLTTIALLINIVLNAVFIFGFLGAPKLGIRGVAFATTIARTIEMLLCCLVASRLKEVHLTIKTIFRKNSLLFSDFIRYSLPALGNDFVWGLAFSMYGVIIGHLGSELVAANSIVNVIRNLATVLCFGMAYGGAVLLGKEMGSDDLEKAKRNASRLVRSTIIIGILGAVLMVAMRPLLFVFADLSEAATAYLTPLLYINAFSVIGMATNTVFICGVFRAGGDSKFGFIVDTFVMWAISIPLGVLCAFVFKLPPLVVYFVLFLDEWEKMLPVVLHYKNKKWMKNITRDFS